MKFTPEVVAALEVLRAAAENDFERHRIDVLERDLHEPPKVEVIDDKHQRFADILFFKQAIAILHDCLLRCYSKPMAAPSPASTAVEKAICRLKPPV